MKGDLSRDTFDRTRHYSAVRLQQGRIVTDADWNEQADLTRDRAEHQARDTIGACGAPLAAAGYALVAETNVFAVHAVDADTAWIAAEDGALLRTDNAGVDWTLIDLQTGAHLRALEQVGGVGWVVGDGGTVRKTSDAGLTWTPQDGGTARNLRGLSVLDADHARAVGDGGIVIATDDGGATWGRIQTTAQRLQAVRFIDAGNGLAVGPGGTILATDDGGRTWAALASGTTAHLRGLAVFGTQQAWVAGQGGTILRSEDGGATWLPCTTPSVVRLNAIGFRDSNEGWAVGDGGTLLHSTDGGANWVLEDAGSSASLHGLALFGNESVWVVGDTSTALRLSAVAPAVAPVMLPAVNLSIMPGRCYVGGALCALEARASYGHQPDGGAAERLTPGAYLLYLDTWQRHLSALEAPSIREVALGGPDTATRIRTLAQVRALPLPPAGPSPWNCASSIPTWDDLTGAPRPRLAARAEPQIAATNLCEIAATAGYRRLENQLYRVEVHAGGASPTFKWSRENGSVAYAVVSLSIDTVQQQTVVRVAARGRDANLDLAAHDRVELVDDDAELIGRAGVLLDYLKDGDDPLELVLAGVPTGTLGQDPTRHPVLRRWDHKPSVAGANLLPLVEDTWIELEDGVQVRFAAGGPYRPGDYWQIPARTITADVEWPRDENGDPIPREPAGVADAYCRLGIVEVDADGLVTVVSDCRAVFPPLTMLEQLLYVSGDGQDAAPGAPLPQALAARVARGSVPIAGAGVRFEVETGDGSIDTGAGGAQAQFETTTDPQGQAACRWTLGPTAAAPARFQRLRASLLDADGRTQPGQAVLFCATASLALQYVSGDGQQAAPGAVLPHPLELRVANGVQGVAGALLQFTVDEGGGNLVGPAAATTDLQGLAAAAWQLGPGGPQRLSADLIDSNGQTLQRLRWNATVVAPATATGGCAITIGKGGRFDQLDSALLEKILNEGDGSACICFLPGTHAIADLALDGGQERRLCLHGCGPTSLLKPGGSISLSGFAALELRDLAIRPEGENGVELKGNTEVRLRTVAIDRPDNQVKSPCLRIAGAQTVSLTGCTVTATMPAAAVVLEDINGDCQVAHNRFDGILSFYGDPAETPTADLLRLLAERAKQARLEPGLGRLRLCCNSVSRLSIGDAMTRRLSQGAGAKGLFESATIADNRITEALNLFVASRMVVVSGSLLLAEPGDKDPYGLFIAERATAVGNIAMVSTETHPLIFGAQLAFEKAANVAFILP